jgi:hypothetical protein
MSSSVRGFVFVACMIYNGITSSEVLSQRLIHISDFRTLISLYLIIGVSLVRLSVNFPKPIKSILSPFLLVPRRLSDHGSVSDMFQIFSILIITRIFAKVMIILINLNIVILFKSTVFTSLLVGGLSRITPFVLILLLPLIRSASWYYVVAYCALCGGTVLLSGIGVIMATGILWRNFVLARWDTT